MRSCCLVSVHHCLVVGQSDRVFASCPFVDLKGERSVLLAWWVGGWVLGERLGAFEGDTVLGGGVVSGSRGLGACMVFVLGKVLGMLSLQNYDSRLHACCGWQRASNVAFAERFKWCACLL